MEPLPYLESDLRKAFEAGRNTKFTWEQYIGREPVGISTEELQKEEQIYEAEQEALSTNE